MTILYMMFLWFLARALKLEIDEDDITILYIIGLVFILLDGAMIFKVVEAVWNLKLLN